MTWDEGISGPHREIAASGRIRIGVLAGPGTGKTTLGLLRRVVRLLEERTPGERILLLSFTRVAAADLRDKVAQLDAPGADKVRATTLHGYCFGLLQRESVLAIIGRTPRILLDHERDLMLRDLGGDFGSIHERRRKLEAFVAGWAQGVDEHVEDFGSSEERAFEYAAMRWLREHEAMLIGEVIPQAFRYLSTNPAAEELLAFDHVIVDEYQDLNVLEQRLLDTLTINCSLCVAGDDDQSIYSVRYANREGILSYCARPDVEKHTIQVSRRCPLNILAMANHLIRQAPGRDKPDLIGTDETAQGIVAIVQWPDVAAEIDGIVSAIASDVSSRRYEAGQILLLTNWRRIGERIRVRLNELDIPAKSFFTEEELDNEQGKEALALLRLVANENDAAALRSLLGLGHATGRTEAYQRVLGYSRTQSQSPRAVLGRLVAGERLGITVPALTERVIRATARARQLREHGLTELVDVLFPEGQESTADLRAVAIDSLAQSDTAEDLLKAVVESVTQDDVPQNPDFVRVMSLHKSKGLTSRCVHIVGAVDGVLPTIRAETSEAVEAALQEGRRLFYVAVTRAAEELVISSSIAMDLADANARGVRYERKHIRRSGDRYTIKTMASPYINELGRDAPTPRLGKAWLESRP